jgi:hypothetical protein
VVRVFSDELPHPCVRVIAKGVGDVRSLLGDVQLTITREFQQVSDIFCVPRHLGTEVWTSLITTVVPRLEFMKKEEMEGSAREFVDLGDVVLVDVWKLENARCEDVDLELLAPVVIVLPPVPQHSPGIIAVPRLNSVEGAVCLAKLFLDKLRLVRIRAKNIKILM